MSSDYPSLFRELKSVSNEKYMLILSIPHSGSEEMSLVQLYIPSEVSHDTISELAEMGNFQFKDVSRLLRSAFRTKAKLIQ